MRRTGMMLLPVMLNKKKKEGEKEKETEKEKAAEAPRKGSWRWWLRRRFSPFNKWKRLDLHVSSFWDDVVYRILSVLEAVTLVATLSCFFLCCGCHF